ncbi:MAG: PEP-CTERM sorting domain-containing protein [Burkholderiaceae bacterium]
MNRSTPCHPIRGRLAALLAAGALLTGSGFASAAPIELAPTLAGSYAAGTGANATFKRIDGAWTGSGVYWKEGDGSGVEGGGQYSNTGGDGFAPIGSYGQPDNPWGTGIWGLVDWRAAHSGGEIPVLNDWSGTVATINHGNKDYAADPDGAARWGAANPLPAGLFPEDTVNETNWTARYTGYIRITEADEYNFGVLFDDGFFLTIWGADDSFVTISSDFLSSRDRLGFADNLWLTEGLYQFELGAYNRLEIGVVNLAWNRGGDENWTTVPTEHLVIDPVRNPDVPVAVATPGTAAVLLAGLAGLLVTRRCGRRGNGGASCHEPGAATR